jgi:hypothetical protein
MTSVLTNFIMVFVNVFSITIGIYFSERIKTGIVAQTGLQDNALSVFVEGILFTLIALVSFCVFFAFLKKEIMTLIPVEVVSYVFILVLFFFYLTV